MSCCKDKKCYDPVSSQCCSGGTGASCPKSASCCDGGKSCPDPNTHFCCDYGTGQTCPHGKTCCNNPGKPCCNPALCEECVNGECKVCPDGGCCVNGECKTPCSQGPYTAEVCGCGQHGEEGWIECSGQKTFHTCLCSTNCNDTYRIECFEGTIYAKRRGVYDRKCNGASYCNITNVEGYERIGETWCVAAYVGCD